MIRSPNVTDPRGQKKRIENTTGAREEPSYFSRIMRERKKWRYAVAILIVRGPKGACAGKVPYVCIVNEIDRLSEKKETEEEYERGACNTRGSWGDFSFDCLLD